LDLEANQQLIKCQIEGNIEKWKKNARLIETPYQTDVK
jgi:hypothetical protein